MSQLFWCTVTALALGLAWIITRPDESPPHWIDKCVDGYYSYLPIYNGKTTTFMMVWNCTQTEPRCVVGKDYHGELTECEERKD